jgi:HTH-type transcriptional regulator, transcriptional repressor of NAD biosynthesis genes
MLIKKGVVFGKFMPPHKGHKALIEFAASQCEQLVVSMSFAPTDAIEPALRFSWLKEIFKDNSNIEIVQELDDFSDDSQPLEEATKEWAVFIKHRFPDVEAFFCSELYGEPLARHLNLPCIYFDIERKQIPISATKIRENPFQYWDFLPEVVKPYRSRKRRKNDYGKAIGSTV